MHTQVYIFAYVNAYQYVRMCCINVCMGSLWVGTCVYACMYSLVSILRAPTVTGSVLSKSIP